MLYSYKLTFAGWWGRNSALVDPTTSLAKLKLALIKALQEELGLPVVNDRGNTTPHIDLKGSRLTMDALQGTVVIVHTDTIVWTQDTIQIPVGEGLHYTLVHMRHVGSHKSVVKPVLDLLLTQFAE